MTPRTLVARIDDALVGQLQEMAGLWSFQYAEARLSIPDRFALSPALPLQPEPICDGASLRPVQWYFDNLLPEEGQRTLLAKDARIDGADAFSLLAWYGAESAGSLTLLPPDAAIEQRPVLHPLTDSALSARIRQLPRAPLTHAAVKRMSLAGAQHKLAVVLADDALFEPAGAFASAHILKPDHPDQDYPHSVVNEWFVMRLAQALGLEVPAVHRRYVPEPVFLIERFDRVRENSPEGAIWRRRHAIDACQLLGLDRSFKYAQGSIERLAELARMCRSPAVARTRLLNWLTFNVLTGNSDAHLKNLSFLVGPAGIQLAPHYDMLSVAVYDSRAFGKPGWPEHTTLAWPILDATRFSQIDRGLILQAARGLGINRSTADRLLAQQRDRIVATAETLYQQFDNDASRRLQARPELGPTMAGESRCLRAIIHTVIKEMVVRLSE